MVGELGKRDWSIKTILTEFSQTISISAHVTLLQLHWLISFEVRALNISKRGSKTLINEFR